MEVLILLVGSVGGMSLLYLLFLYWISWITRHQESPEQELTGLRAFDKWLEKNNIDFDPYNEPDILNDRKAYDEYHTKYNKLNDRFDEEELEKIVARIANKEKAKETSDQKKK